MHNDVSCTCYNHIASRDSSGGVDQHNFSFVDFRALLADSDSVSKGPSSFFLETDSLRSDSSLSVSYSGMFFFPFSLRVNRLHGSLRRESMAESPLLAALVPTGHSESVTHSARSAEMRLDSSNSTSQLA